MFIKVAHVLIFSCVILNGIVLATDFNPFTMTVFIFVFTTFLLMCRRDILRQKKQQEEIKDFIENCDKVLFDLQNYASIDESQKFPLQMNVLLVLARRTSFLHYMYIKKSQKDNIQSSTEKIERLTFENNLF